MAEYEVILEEITAWAALQRLGLAVGCDHAHDMDGIHATERCIESALRDTNQRWDCDLWGWPWFGLGRLTLRFVAAGDTYTYWVIFLTSKISLAIHVGGRKKAGNAGERSADD